MIKVTISIYIEKLDLIHEKTSNIDTDLAHNTY